MSVRLRLSASETPLFVTSTVNVREAPPAVTVFEPNVFATLSDTFSTMSTESLAEALSSSEVTSALLPTPVALFVVEATW